MFEITELAKGFLNNSDTVKDAFNDFVSNTPEVTGLNEKTIKEVAAIIGSKSCSEGAYNIFGTVYNLDYINNFLNNRDYYYINDIDTNELNICLKYEYDEDGEWIPVIFIKEFWVFYSVYTARNRKETKEGIDNKQDTSTNIYSILDGAIELKHIRTSLENLNLHYNEIYEILEAIVKKLN
jgi:hypothetical protein